MESHGAQPLWLQRPLVKWPLVLAFWTVVGLSFASQLYFSSSLLGQRVTWAQSLQSSLADWYVWAVVAVPVFWLGTQFPLSRAQWKLNLVAHLLFGPTVAVGYVALRAGVGTWQYTLAGIPVAYIDIFTSLLTKLLLNSLRIYWVVVAASHAWAYYQKYHERELGAADLERRLVQAKLKALQMQLNPHFLFNTLNAISSLMHKDVDAADRMLTRLSDLLRRALDTSDAHEVALKEELDVLRTYLDIERVRFGDRLATQFDVAQECLSAKVPNLLLQPLVENAIRHGVEPRSKPACIQVAAWIEAGRLHLRIADNGKGLPQDGLPREGVGLANTKARLQELYGAAHRFQIGNAPTGGVIVEIDLPLRTD